MNQLPVLTRPNAADPRFPKPKPVGEQSSDERVASRYLASPLRCDRSNCPTLIHVQLPPDLARRKADADSRGFMRGRGDKDHLLYCSRRCRDQHATDPAKVGDPCRQPHCIKEGLSIGKCYCKPQIGGAGPQCPITRVTVRDTVDGSGIPHRAIVCDRWGCHDKRFVDPSATAARVCQFAVAEGFRQGPMGTTCSAQCEKMLGADVRSGRQPPPDDDLAGRTVVDTAAPRQAVLPCQECGNGEPHTHTGAVKPIPVPPEPRAPQTPKGDHGIWCFETGQYFPSTMQPWAGSAKEAESRLVALRMMAAEEATGATYAVRDFASAEPPARPLSRRERRAMGAAKAAEPASTPQPQGIAPKA